MISSTEEHLMNEIKLIREMFTHRGYPEYIIDQCLSRTLSKDGNVSNKIITAQKPKPVNVVLQLHPQLSKRLVKIWTNVLKMFEIPVDIRVIYLPGTSLGTYLPNYANVVQPRKNVVYMIQCPQC